MASFPLARVVIAALLCLGPWAQAKEIQSEFAQVQSILADKCYKCHGPEKQKGGLRLDRKTSALTGGDSGKAIEPGKAEASKLYKLVAGLDPELMMPPKDKGTPLSKSELALLKDWINHGAPWSETVDQKHWSYLSPVSPSRPLIKNKAWPRNSLDYFVLEKLAKEKLTPAPEADRGTLLRRVSLDLTGLPPTPAELESFLGDRTTNAFEKVVDRLLASPHYGERWARPWLDLARYADTQGYEKDNRRTMWPYRDWVIDALNRNLPFDQFTVEQLAGDLLPHPTRDQKVATGFHRNTMTNTEGGTDDEEFRHEAVIDRVNTTMVAWMGTTMGCAQCHNHKYDPLTMKEYYQLFAIFNNTADSDKDDERPTLKLPTLEQESKLAALRKQIATLDTRYKENTPALNQAQDAWETKTRRALQSWRTLTPSSATSAGGAAVSIRKDHSILLSGNNPSNDVLTVEIGVAEPATIAALQLSSVPDDSLPKKGSSRDSGGTFVLTQLKLEWIHDHRRVPVSFKTVAADHSQKDRSVTNLLSATPSKNGWSPRAPDEARSDASAYLTLSEPLHAGAGDQIVLRLINGSDRPEANLGSFRLGWAESESTQPAPVLPRDIRQTLLDSNRTASAGTALQNYFRSIAPELKTVREDLAAARKAEADLDRSIPITSVMEELAPGRESHVHLRGSFLSKGDRVEPGVPAAFHPMPTNAPLNRLSFARWLASKNNPLTARVVVNRLWEQYFGIGIVETCEDFGKQGEPPSNPKLLDWLATDFMRQDWNLKGLHRVIVTSATYRQSSRVTPSLLQRDPFNRLLARGPRTRLDAETIRDQALKASGLLSEKIGGPSVMPPQPEGLWQVVYSGDKWETSKDEDKYRRGLYTFWRRTIPHPEMTTFDAPSREFCVVRRTRSNTPLQALTVLNDPAYVEAAEALARRMVHEAGSSLEKRIDYGMKLCLARPAKPAEIKTLRDLFEQERLRYSLDPEAAKKISSQYLGKGDDDCDMAELAAWTVVANVLLNLDEMITKG